MKKFLALALSTVLLAGVLTGCTTESADTNTTTETEQTEEAPAEGEEAPAEGEEEAPADGELTTVTFVVPRGLECMDDMALWSAVAMGYFEEEGINFEMEQAFGTTDIRMVATGQADFGYPSPNLILPSIQEGLPVKAVCAADAINIFGMAVPADSDIQTWEDLKGHTVALGDAAWETIALPTVTAAGLNADTDLEYIVAGDTRYQMVNEGQIDVLFTWISEVEQLIGQGFDFRYLDGEEVLSLQGAPVITNQELIDTNPELIEGFVRAFTKGLYFVKCNPEAAADITLNRFPSIQISWEGALGCANGRVRQAFGSTPEAEEEIMNAGIGMMSDDKWNTVVDWAVQCGIITEAIPLDQIYTNEFVDTSWDKAEVEADAAAYECTSQVYLDAHQ